MIRKKLRREEVPLEEISALYPRDLLKEFGKAAAEEEARYFLRYWFGGENLSDIPPRGRQEGQDWCARGEQWGPKRQELKLRDMIAASKHDPDYWDALNDIALHLQATNRPWPVRLRLWDIEVRQGLLSKPPRPRGNCGQPRYAKDNRNFLISFALLCLRYLGMGKMESYRVIADELGISMRTVMNAIRSHRMRSDSLLRPWECWSQWR